MVFWKEIGDTALSRNIYTSMGITWESFLSAAESIVKVSEKLNDGWKLITVRKPPNSNESYLCKKEVKLESENLLIWEYHIVYSLSYSVPVMYFNVSDNNGEKIRFDKLTTILKTSTDDGGVLISQAEHPLLIKPYYFLHPCNTSSIIESMSESRNPIISWLSVAAPLVRLELDLEYAFQC